MRETIARRTEEGVVYTSPTSVLLLRHFGNALVLGRPAGLFPNFSAAWTEDKPPPETIIEVLRMTEFRDSCYN